MTLLESKRIVQVDDIHEFMEQFKAYEDFKRIYGKDFANWDYEESDYDIIEVILEQRSGMYHVETVWKDQQQDDCYFLIYVIQEDIEERVC